VRILGLGDGDAALELARSLAVAPQQSVAQ